MSNTNALEQVEQDVKNISLPPDDGNGAWRIGIGSEEDRAAEGYETKKVPLDKDPENRVVFFRVRKEVAEAVEA